MAYKFHLSLNLLLHLFTLLYPLEQILLAPAESSVSFTKLEAVPIIAFVFLWYLLICSFLRLSFLSIFCFLFSPLLIYSLCSIFIILSYYCLILLERYFTFINFFWVTPFISLLNSLINSLLSKPLSLVALLNSYTNFSIFFYSCFTFFNLTNFTNLLSPFLNSYFRLVIKSFTIANSKLLSHFLFKYLLTLLIYSKTYWTCSFTVTSLIFILMSSPYTVIKSETLLVFSLNVGSLDTFILDVVLGSKFAAFPSSSSLSANNTNNTTVFSCYYLLWSKFYFIFIKL